MLIAISGSQGCGKTSVITSLSNDFSVVDRKTSRSIQKEWGKTLEEINADSELTTKFQDEIITRKHRDELSAINSPEIWITERTYADLFTYALITLGKENKYSEFLNTYYTRCMCLQQSYSLVFYLKAGYFGIETDPHRAASNHHYGRMVDLTMLDITNNITSPNILKVIDTPHHDIRTTTIKALIKGFLQSRKER